MNGKWLQLAVLGGDEHVRAERSEAVEVELCEWWAGEKPAE